MLSLWKIKRFLKSISGKVEVIEKNWDQIRVQPIILSYLNGNLLILLISKIFSWYFGVIFAVNINHQDGQDESIKYLGPDSRRQFS